MTSGLATKGAASMARIPYVGSTPRASATRVSALLERSVVVCCLAALAVHFYSTAGRFLDQDEIYFFHVAHAVSRGVPLYSGLEPYYPPLLFYLGAALFAVCPDLYAGLLAARLLVITCSLVGFWFVFDIFRRLRLTPFIVLATFVIPFLTQFDLKLMEFRADNLICPIIAAQAWLLFRLNEGTSRLARSLLAVVMLALVAVHLSQKAVPIEAALIVVLTVTQFALLRSRLRRHSVAIATGVLILGGLAAWSAAYRLFVQRTYVDTLQMMAVYPSNDGAEFLLTCLERNLGFWLLSALGVVMIAEGLSGHWRRYLLPLSLLAAAGVLLYASSFPYLHYQLYLVWAALLALPFAVRAAGDLLEGGTTAAFAVCAIAVLSSLRTFQPFAFPHQSLPDYARTVDRAQRAIGSEAVGFVGGTLISASSVWPQDPINGYKYHRDYVLEQRWRMRDLLQQTDAKFVFDPRALISQQALPADRLFIGQHYRETASLPLLIASQWQWMPAGRSSFPIEMGGRYRARVFGDGAGATRIDGIAAGGGAIVQLDRGAHRLDATTPGVMLMEFASPAIASVDWQDAAAAQTAAYKEVDADFSAAFRLLGVLRLAEGDGEVFHFFWQKTGTVDAELLAFHHFRDGAGNFLRAENIDPGAAWYSLRELPVGHRFAYRVRVPRRLGARTLDVGLYHRDDIGERLLCGGNTYVTIDLTRASADDGREAKSAAPASASAAP